MRTHDPDTRKNVNGIVVFGVFIMKRRVMARASSKRLSQSWAILSINVCIMSAEPSIDGQNVKIIFEGIKF